MWKTCWLSLLLFAAVGGAHPAVIEEEFVFDRPPFASCHAATLTEAENGAILCSWFAGEQEGTPDVAIWLSTHEKKWGAPRKVAQVEGVPCWNPVLFTLPSHEIVLFYRVGRHPQCWSALFKKSHDNGKRWSEPVDVPAGVLGPIKNKPLLLSDGTWLCGSSMESWMRWGCWMDITSNEGQTWEKSTPINVEGQLFGIIQPALFFGKNNTIQMLARSHQVGYICSSESHDQGRTWSPAKPTTLPNPNSGIDATNLSDGRVVLVYNHSQEEQYPLNVAVSNDGGESWTMEVVLEEEPGEYSYPSVIQAKNGNIHIVYTWNRTNIKHVVLSPEKL